MTWNKKTHIQYLSRTIHHTIPHHTMPCHTIPFHSNSSLLYYTTLPLHDSTIHTFVHPSIRPSIPTYLRTYIQTVHLSLSLSFSLSLPPSLPPSLSLSLSPSPHMFFLDDNPGDDTPWGLLFTCASTACWTAVPHLEIGWEFEQCHPGAFAEYRGLSDFWCGAREFSISGANWSPCVSIWMCKDAGSNILVPCQQVKRQLAWLTAHLGASSGFMWYVEDCYAMEIM